MRARSSGRSVLALVTRQPTAAGHGQLPPRLHVPDVSQRGGWRAPVSVRLSRPVCSRKPKLAALPRVRRASPECDDCSHVEQLHAVLPGDRPGAPGGRHNQGRHERPGAVTGGLSTNVQRRISAEGYSRGRFDPPGTRLAMRQVMAILRRRIRRYEPTLFTRRHWRACSRTMSQGCPQCVSGPTCGCLARHAILGTRSVSR
jgi:hypothetical protein